MRRVMWFTSVCTWVIVLGSKIVVWIGRMLRSMFWRAVRVMTEMIWRSSFSSVDWMVFYCNIRIMLIWGILIRVVVRIVWIFVSCIMWFRFVFTPKWVIGKGCVMFVMPGRFFIVDWKNRIIS